VLVGVPGGGKRPQRQPAEVDLVAVRQAVVLEGAPSGGGGQDRGAGVPAELDGAGEEVGVQMRIRGERNRQAAPLGRPVQSAQVTACVDSQRAAVTEVEQIGAVASPSSTSGMR